MRVLTSLLFIVSFINTGFGEDDHGIRRPQADKRGVHKSAPESQKVGLNGKLIWVNDLLILETPAGKKYSVTTSDKDMEQKLVDITAKEGNEVDLAGVRTEGKFKVDRVEWSQSSKNSKKSSNRIIVTLNRKAPIKEINDRLSSPDIKALEMSEPLGLIFLESDFSLAELKRRIAEDNLLRSNIQTVERDVR